MPYPPTGAVRSTHWLLIPSTLILVSLSLIDIWYWIVKIHLQSSLITSMHFMQLMHLVYMCSCVDVYCTALFCNSQKLQKNVSLVKCTMAVVSKTFCGKTFTAWLRLSLVTCLTWTELFWRSGDACWVGPSSGYIAFPPFPCFHSLPQHLGILLKPQVLRKYSRSLERSPGCVKEKLGNWLQAWRGPSFTSMPTWQ